jgi:hypothetical protein
MPSFSSSRTLSALRCGTQTHERARVHGVRSRANSLGITEIKTPTVRTATATHDRRAMSSRRPRKPILCLGCSLAPSVTTLLYSTTAFQALRQTLRGSYFDRREPEFRRFNFCESKRCMLVSAKPGADFSRGCALPPTRPPISATHPHRLDARIVTSRRYQTPST